MELDDMKQAWQSLDRQMARRYALDLEQYRERKLGSVRFRLLPVKLGLVARMVLGVAIIAASTSFWIAHLGSPHLIVSGVLLQAYGLLLVGSAAWEMQMLVGIDYAAPVLTIQRRLATFRAWRVRLVPVWMTTGCFVWIPLTLVAFKAWLGADIYAHAPEVVLYFLSSGGVAMLAFWLIARWVPGAASVLNDSSVGGSLGRSQQVLNDIARFEAEL
jgi:hypothetical protein